MNPRMIHAYGPGGERGFVLATVLVFLLVLTVTAFTSAALTRTDIQLVNNRYNERKAFYAAEAGVAEALLRLSMNKATNVTVDGSTFDASFAAASFKPNPAWKDWRAQILFAGSAPVLDSGNHLVTTPTLQPAATRLSYSAASAGQQSPPLTIRWSLCTDANVATGAFGCVAAGDIRTVKGVKALEIVSTGAAAAAQRTITMMVTNAPDLPSVLTSLAGCDNKNKTTDGIKLNGSSSLEVSGGIWVNSSCSTAIKGVGSSEIHAGGSINVVGGVSMSGVEPKPKTGADLMADPLAALLPPCFGAIAGPSCQEITPTPVVRGGSGFFPVTTKVSSGTLNPGIYYGGLELSGGTITMNPGVYIMAGGGFSVSKNKTTVNGSEVTIYNTQDDVAFGRLSTAGQYGDFSVTTNASINLSAPASATAANPYAGVVLFQDRANTKGVSFQGGELDGVIDGVIYAINSDMTLQGGHLRSNLLVSTLELQGSPEIDPPTTQAGGTGGGLSRVAWKDF